MKPKTYIFGLALLAGIFLIGVIGLVIDQCFRGLHRVAFPWLYARD